MRFHGVAGALLTSPARVAVLQTLLRQPGREWTGREAARAAGVSAPQGLEALGRLADEGMVAEKRVGRASVWSLVGGHYLVKALKPLARVDEAAQAALVDALERGLKGSGAIEAYLFGSVAEGHEDPNSDVDLLVLFPGKSAAGAWRPKLRDLEVEVRARFGNTLQAVAYTTAQARRGAPARIHKVAKVRGKVIKVKV